MSQACVTAPRRQRGLSESEGTASAPRSAQLVPLCRAGVTGAQGGRHSVLASAAPRAPSLCRGTRVPAPLPSGLSAPRAGAGPGPAAGREREASRVGGARLRVPSQPRPVPVAAGPGLPLPEEGAVRPPPVGDRSCPEGVQGQRPRGGPQGTGESRAAPCLALRGQPLPLQPAQPRPSLEGLRTGMRGGAARAPPHSPASVAW